MHKLDDFRNIADKILDDVKVSEALKEKTLKRCRRTMNYKRRISASIATIGLTAALFMIMFKVSLPFYSENQNVHTGGSNEILTPMITKDTPSTLSSNPGSENNSVYFKGTIEDAKMYFGEDFQLPKYIPVGFTQEFIQVPRDNAMKGMEVTVEYKNDTKNFSLIVKRNIEDLDTANNKKVNINGINVFVLSEDIVENEHYIEAAWINNSRLYKIIGNISEKEVMKIITSMI